MREEGNPMSSVPLIHPLKIVWKSPSLTESPAPSSGQTGHEWNSPCALPLLSPNAL